MHIYIFSAFNALAKSIIAINRSDVLTKISGSNLGAQQKQILSREVLLNDIERYSCSVKLHHSAKYLNASFPT